MEGGANERLCPHGFLTFLHLDCLHIIFTFMFSCLRPSLMSLPVTFLVDFFHTYSNVLLSYIGLHHQFHPQIGRGWQPRPPEWSLISSKSDQQPSYIWHLARVAIEWKQLSQILQNHWQPPIIMNVANLIAKQFPLVFMGLALSFQNWQSWWIPLQWPFYQININPERWKLIWENIFSTTNLTWLSKCKQLLLWKLRNKGTNDPGC